MLSVKKIIVALQKLTIIQKKKKDFVFALE